MNIKSIKYLLRNLSNVFYGYIACVANALIGLSSRVEHLKSAALVILLYYC